MKIGQYELVFGIKEFLVLSVAFFAALGMLAFYSFFLSGQGPQYPSLSKLNQFDSVSGAFVLATPVKFTAENCDIFVSGPDKQMRYFDTVACEDLSKTKITADDLLNFSGGVRGTYTLIIFSEETSEGTSYTFSIS